MTTVTSLYHHSSATYKPPSNASEPEIPGRRRPRFSGSAIVLPRSNRKFQDIVVLEFPVQAKALRPWEAFSPNPRTN